jgi:hypothetical protein
MMEGGIYEKQNDLFFGAGSDNLCLLHNVWLLPERNFYGRAHWGIEDRNEGRI